MKRIWFMSILFGVGTIFAHSQDSIVVIPDTAFLYALIEHGVDTNGDSLISYGEAEAVTDLDIESKGISDLTGIEYMVNMEELDCSWNQLTNLDLSNMHLLSALFCQQNNLTRLDISNDTSLVSLWCNDNQLTSLDVSTNINLVGGPWAFGVWNYGMRCGNNQLTSLDVSNNPKLVRIDCRDNQLSELDVSNNPELGWLFCENNHVTELDVSNNPKLKYLACSGNELTSLDISNNINLRLIDLSGMISLGEVCVWESFAADTSAASERDMEIYITGSTALCFQTDCNGICREEIILSLLVDTIYPAMFLEAISSDDGMMYLVPVDTDKDLEVIRGACSDSIIAVMDTPVSIPLEGMENGTYWLYATDTSGYISEPSAFTVTGVGIEQRNTENLKIFPNPTYSLLTIEMASSDMINIEIISLNGQIQLSKEIDGTTHQIDLSSFQTGIYFISIRSEDFVTTRKIVKL